MQHFSRCHTLCEFVLLSLVTVRLYEITEKREEKKLRKSSHLLVRIDMKRFFFILLMVFIAANVSRRWNLKCLVALVHTLVRWLGGRGADEATWEKIHKSDICSSSSLLHTAMLCVESKNQHIRGSSTCRHVTLTFSTLIDFPPHLVRSTFSLLHIFTFFSSVQLPLSFSPSWQMPIVDFPHLSTVFSIVRTTLYAGKCAKINAELSRLSIVIFAQKLWNVEFFFPHSYSFHLSFHSIHLACSRAFIFHFLYLLLFCHFFCSFLQLQMLSIGKRANMKACLWNEMLTCK